jgi:hypothetical protein
MNRTYKTAKGTELPLLNLKGRDYLEVKFRLVWFREDHPDWSIETEFLSIDAHSACARAVVKDATGRVIATSHKTESESNFPDFMEKAETGAIGRALALIGYGTQFCADELDEGERIVDSPVAKRSEYSQGTSFVPGVSRAASSAHPPSPGKFDLGEFRINFGKKYLGKSLKDIPRSEIEGYIDWLEKKSAERGGSDLNVRLLKDAVNRFHHPEKFIREKNGVAPVDHDSDPGAHENTPEVAAS